jgi:hypothetical protein
MATPTTLPATFVAGNVLTAAQMNDLRGAFRILQVVQTLKTDTFTSGTINQGAEADITGLSATITPSSTDSKVLVFTSVLGSTLGTALALAPMSMYKVYRGATAIGVGDAAGSRTRITSFDGVFTTSDGMGAANAIILDSPATTSATTYKCTFVNTVMANATAVFYCNMTTEDGTNANYVPRTVSSITLMEISA